MNGEHLALEDLKPGQREIAEVIGLDNYIALTKYFGGTCPYIQKYSELLKSPRNSELQEEFTGYNFSELARKYDLSERHIRTLVHGIVIKARSRPMDGQMHF